MIAHSKKMRNFAPLFTGCPDGGIGRRAGLKHQWIHFHAGSTPALGTEAEELLKLPPFSFLSPVTHWFVYRLSQVPNCRIFPTFPCGDRKITY